MRTHLTILITIFALVLLSSFVRAQQPLLMPPIPVPLIPQRAVGTRLPQLELIQKLFKEKRYLELYKESAKMRNVPEIHWSSEGIALLRWIEYYELSSPLFTCEALEEMGDIYFREDYVSKISAWEKLCSENTKKAAEMFSIDEKKYLEHRVETLVRIFTFFDKIYVYSLDKKAHKKEDASLEEKFKIADAAELKELEKRGVYTQSHSLASREFMTHEMRRSARRFEMRNLIWNLSSHCMDSYVSKLVACFPKQGQKVQEYVKRTGFHRHDSYSDTTWVQNFYKKNPYPEELGLALLLERAVDRNKDVKWVLVGLPSKEKVRKLEQEESRKFKEELQRLKEKEKRRKEKEAKSKTPSEPDSIYHSKVQ